MKLFSPAKINLFFRVLGKRPDGFHEIASLYQAISLGDFLTIVPSDGADQLVCSDPSVPTDSSNLILQAAKLFREKTELQRFFRFTLEKNIPMESGLGGGSSNAATTLWGLNQLMGTDIEIAQLRDWGAELGSDVPFFLSRGRAFCEGKGERLTEESECIKRELWIAKPSLSLSTQSVYKHLDLKEVVDRKPLDLLQSHRKGLDLCYNDLEHAAFDLLPQLKQIKAELAKHGFDQVHMTGSGTAFFCLGKKLPSHPQIRFYSAQFLYRSDEDWYSPSC